MNAKCTRYEVHEQTAGESAYGAGPPPNEITVTVLVPTFNHERFISGALDGILAQRTHFPIEVVVGDDCSTDRTLAIAKDYERRFPNALRVMPAGRNIGVAANVIRLLNSARGEFIAFCEGDDLWTDERKLEMQVNTLKANPEMVATFHDVRVIDADGRMLFNSKIKEYWGQSIRPTFAPRDLARGAAIPTLSLLMRRMPLRLERMKTVLNCDTFLFALLGEYGSAMLVGPVMGAYRVHGGGVWSAKSRELKMIASEHTFSELAKALKPQLRSYAILTFGEHAMGCSLYFLRRRGFRRALVHGVRYLKGLGWILGLVVTGKARGAMAFRYLATPGRCLKNYLGNGRPDATARQHVG